MASIPTEDQYIEWLKNNDSVHHFGVRVLLLLFVDDETREINTDQEISGGDFIELVSQIASDENLRPEECEESIESGYRNQH